jgi:hypothetical protein
MERQGGAREPSEDLVLVGELPKRTAAAPGTGSGGPAGTGADGVAGSMKPPADAPPASEPATTASLAPPVIYSRGSDGQLTRVVPVPMERSWLVAQSVLKSLGWDIDRADLSTGRIRTEPRNVTFKDFVLYGEGVRHSLDIVVRPVSGGESSISVKRDVFQEQRIFWAKERKAMPTPESSVEQAVLDAIERVL